MTTTPVLKAVRARLAYDKNKSLAKAWLDAEKALSDREYEQFAYAYALAKGMKL